MDTSAKPEMHAEAELQKDRGLGLDAELGQEDVDVARIDQVYR